MKKWEVDEVALRLSRLLDALVSVAMEDHIITDDESAIIEKTRQKLWKMEKEIASIVDLSEDEFKSRLALTLRDVLEEVQREVYSDGIATEEEEHLIKQIKKYMEEQGLHTLV